MLIDPLPKQVLILEIISGCGGADFLPDKPVSLSIEAAHDCPLHDAPSLALLLVLKFAIGRERLLDEGDDVEPALFRLVYVAQIRRVIADYHQLELRGGRRDPRHAVATPEFTPG